MNNHTPGPWDVDEDERGPFVCNGETRNMIADTSSCGHLSFSEIKANTTLIAAAPDLMAACEACMTLLIRYENRAIALEIGTGAAINAAHAAIAKARGNQ